MINFRYHLVSVTAVFLALAIGLVLGTTALNGPALEAMSATVDSLADENKGLRDELLQMETDAAAEHDFATAVAPETLQGTLEEQNVLVLSVGAADSADVEGVVSMLGLSEAANAGQLNFSDDFTDPNKGAQLVDLVADVTPKAFEPPNNNDGVESAAALLAAALFAEGSTVTVDERDTVIAALVALKMVTEEKKLTAEKATAVVIVTGSPYTGTDAVDRNTNVLTFATQFGGQGPTVLASPTIAGDGNVVAAIVADATLAKKISTVDNAAGPGGQLGAVMALPERIEGKAGHYGTGEGATGLLPVPE